ncbi:armadillo-type protein [Phlyctochytrium arcticum]|nr:armadillo-type protein [Phlyctochytrium arcticum]
MAEQTLCDNSHFGVTDVRTLVLLLRSPEPLICAGALDALTKYAESATKHRLQILSLGVIDHLLQLALSPEPVIKKAAVACLAASTELTNETHPELRRRDVIKLIISLLGSEEAPEVQEEAAFSLASLAKDFANKADIRQEGGIKALVNLLVSTDPDVKKNTGYALSIMLEDYASRMEVRYMNGLAPLLELLASEYPEVQETALTSLIRCAEDHGNRIEIRKLNGIRRLVDFLNQDVPELHHLTLLCLANCLEDSETANIFHELNGITTLVRMCSLEDPRLKKNAALALARAARQEKNQNYIREAGALPILLTNLGGSDVLAISHAAMALAFLAKNEINQLELAKLDAIETLVKLLSHEDLDVNRQSAAALSSLCLNAKLRAKVKNCDGLPHVVKLLTLSDNQSLVNACECLANLAEDSNLRGEIVKTHNGVHALVMVLQKDDAGVQATASLALARCMQDAEGRTALTKEMPEHAVSRLIELLESKDMTVCRNTAYALSNAAQLDSIAMSACRSGAISALINLVKDPSRHSPRFASDALEKLLNYNLSAKYWLRNHLTATNQVVDKFYDLGSAGSDIELLHKFPTLQELQQQSVDKRREILLIDPSQDTYLMALTQVVSENLASRTPLQQIKQIASVVSQVMGGSVEPSRLQDIPYKFKITELKLKFDSNVILLGHVTQGTFYHRALLFKWLCDKLGLLPCSLVRGEYRRAWNVVDVHRQSLTPVKPPTPATPVTASAPTKPEKHTSGRSRQTATASKGERDSSAAGGLAGASLPAAQPLPQAETIVPITIPDPCEDPSSIPDGEAIVDLIFEPGRLLELGSPEAEMYQRFQ